MASDKDMHLKRPRSPDGSSRLMKQSKGPEIIREWHAASDISLEEICTVIEGSGKDMEVPPNVRRYLSEGRLKALTLVSGNTFVGALIYGFFAAGNPSGMFPYPEHNRSELYFVGVTMKRAGHGRRLLQFWESQAQLLGAEVLQVVPAKIELLGTFYKNYQIDKHLEGGAHISKWVRKHPTPTPNGQRQNKGGQAERPRSEGGVPWQAFMQQLQGMQGANQQTQQADRPPLVTRAPKVTYRQGSGTATPGCQILLENLGKDEDTSPVRLSSIPPRNESPSKPAKRSHIVGVCRESMPGLENPKGQSQTAGPRTLNRAELVSTGVRTSQSAQEQVDTEPQEQSVPRLSRQQMATPSVSESDSFYTAQSLFSEDWQTANSTEDSGQGLEDDAVSLPGASLQNALSFGAFRLRRWMGW